MLHLTLAPHLWSRENKTMELPLKDEIADQPDLAHEARKFRNVLKSFERNLHLVFADTGLAPHVDHAALATAFATWRTRFDATKHLADINRHDFVVYAAGLMLKELIAAKPLSALPTKDAPVNVNHPLARWPEGYAYTSFCLSVATAILKEMGAKDVLDEQLADDPAFWDSFRENVADSPENAVAFFDLVCGKEPNWDAPDVPWLRNALRGRNILPPSTTAAELK
jgi:hypothetical protein